MNLADFPISVLQRQQPVDEQGTKKDTAVYTAGRYDPRSRQRMTQRVVLESSSRHGLPTPADENVVLALLFVAKHTHNFADPRVHFAPRQLFGIMGWAPNSRSYDRLRDVLRRLKALVIRYENSWWDIEGREYEAEVATGIISEYELVRQVSGRKKPSALPPSWVYWSPHFQQSLSKGNIKKLNLELLFSLRLPTSQRMYRFLDKRFYQTSVVEMDLRDFACGHIGLTAVDNVAELKRRLAPALAELEGVGFLAPATEERYQKVGTGAWRIRLRAAQKEGSASAVAAVPPESDVVADSIPTRGADATPLAKTPEADALVGIFYATWDGRVEAAVNEADRKQASRLLSQVSNEAARAVIVELVRVLRRRWPECKTFSGAMDKYLGEAIQAHDLAQRRTQKNQRDQTQQQRDREEQLRREEDRKQREQRWQTLSEEERQRITDEVMAKHPNLKGHAAILHALCLHQLPAAPV